MDEEEIRDLEQEVETVIGEINLEPDYHNMVLQFTTDAMFHGARILNEFKGEKLSTVRSFLVSLNVALQSVTNGEDMIYVREHVHNFTNELVAADEKQKRRRGR